MISHASNSFVSTFLLTSLCSHSIPTKLTTHLLSSHLNQPSDRLRYSFRSHQFLLPTCTNMFLSTPFPSPTPVGTQLGSCSFGVPPHLRLNHSRWHLIQLCLLFQLRFTMSSLLTYLSFSVHCSRFAVWDGRCRSPTSHGPVRSPL